MVSVPLSSTSVGCRHVAQGQSARNFTPLLATRTIVRVTVEKCGCKNQRPRAPSDVGRRRAAWRPSGSGCCCCCGRSRKKKRGRITRRRRNAACTEISHVQRTIALTHTRTKVPTHMYIYMCVRISGVEHRGNDKTLLGGGPKRARRAHRDAGAGKRPKPELRQHLARGPGQHLTARRHSTNTDCHWP